MLIFDILLKKQIVTDHNGESILDLTNNSVSVNFIRNCRINKIILVSDEFEMRPDLVAKVTMGSANYADILLKFNGISNPYSLSAGMFLFIPNKDDILNNMVARINPKTSLRDIVFNSNKLSTKDKARLKYMEEKAAALKNSGSVLPPNFDDNGNQEVIVRDGKIIFGDNTSLPLDKCTLQPLSIAAFKQKILLNKIRNS